jgi:hypothetical protein
MVQLKMDKFGNKEHYELLLRTRSFNLEDEGGKAI